MSTYFITNPNAPAITNLPSYSMGGGSYSLDACISLTYYSSNTLDSNSTVIYDLRLALNEDDSTINNNKVWNDIGSNNSAKISNLIIYASNDLNTASWKNIQLKKR